MGLGLGLARITCHWFFIQNPKLKFTPVPLILQKVVVPYAASWCFALVCVGDVNYFAVKSCWLLNLFFGCWRLHE